jgi:hypothetical protein
MDAIQFLKKEHEAAKDAFGRMEQASRPERGVLWRQLRRELEMHEQIEEAALYDPLSEDAESRDAQLADWKDQHAEEVRTATRLMRAIDAEDPESPHWLARVTELKQALQDHIEQEEHQVFPRIGLVWNRDRLDRAGADLERMKGERSRPAA